MKYLQIKLEDDEADLIQDFATKTERNFSKAGKFLLLEKLHELSRNR